MLVLRLGEQVGTETIVDALWRAEASRDRGNALRILVSHLRKALAVTGGPPPSRPRAADTGC